MTTMMPPEWAPHDACWLAFPHLAVEWQGHLEQAQADIAAFARALVAAGERVELLVHTEAVEQAARALVGDVAEVRYHRVPYGDCWVRDTGCVFVTEPDPQAPGQQRLAARSFVFDSWGGKFDMPGDPEVSMKMAELAEVPAQRAEFVLEGGGIETDGLGTFLVTDCVVDRNRGWTRETAAQELMRTLGAKVVHFADGLLQNDHTDGHIDTLARFIAPGKVVCMAPRDDRDPNGGVLLEVIASLEGKRDARGEPLEVVTIPSPGAVIIDDFLTPASYCNFYIANRAVLLPAYGVPGDELARAALAPHFPDHEVVLVPARGLIVGGGGLHCASQQQPSAPRAEGARG
ncbi:MAG: agmatine deiminase family protein [Sandaracinaceae bacterium]|nr:agmatine deiminase family protein [Sandaracinaceae bacterium]